ncbi:unnamed protein product [Blepharisma stoltei]|uniref:Cyclin n=1 Tax=Blepharisma stoltei TaxID=1481888 RepID=A0AAU9INY9_9CILI|nr:unnamed protein product [Blepharisma stoltei]
MTKFEAMSHMLIKKISNQESEVKHLDIFSVERPLPIHLFTYLEYLQDELECSDAVFALAYLYIEKLLQKYPKFVINASNLLRLTFTSVVSAFKFTEDKIISYNDIAKLGHLDVKELSVLERVFLSSLEYELWDEEIRQNYEDLLISWNNFSMYSDIEYDEDLEDIGNLSTSTTVSLDELTNFSELSAFFTDI